MKGKLCQFLKKFSFSPLLGALLVLLCSCLSLLSFGSAPVSASSVGVANSRVYTNLTSGWQSGSGWLVIPNNAWITGQQVAVGVSKTGDVFAGTVNFRGTISSTSNSNYFNSARGPQAENLKCFVSANGIWNGISNENFVVSEFNIDYTSRTAGSTSDVHTSYNIYASFSGKTSYKTNGGVNFYCTMDTPTNGLFSQVGANACWAEGYETSYGGSRTASQLTVSFASDSTEAIAGLQATLSAQNQTIINQNGQIISGLDQVQSSIKGAQNQAHEDAEATQNAINDQTKQDQEQYDKDKQEEAEREQQGQDDADKVASIFSFQFGNPFAVIFEMFNPGGCVQIPTIASWLHVEDPTVCPWFGDNVRSVLSPVFTISSMMLLFGFAVRWLRGGDTIRF